MNSLFFNKTASELNATVYGFNREKSSLQELQLNKNGELLVGTSEPLKVNGDINVTNAINIANENLNINGEVSVTNPITVSNAEFDITVTGNKFVSDKANLTNVCGTGVVFDATDISSLRNATLFIENFGPTKITISLQLSPDGVVYFNDPNYTNIVIPPGAQDIIIVHVFAQFIRLQYNLGEDTATFSAYYNGQA